MTEQKNPLGPNGRYAAENVARLRRVRKLGYQELSEMLSAAGRPIPALGLARIEKGQRRIDVDDLVALAAAFRVNPSTLTLPPKISGQVELSGVGEVSANLAWDWADGQSPMYVEGEDTNAAMFDFDQVARPPGKQRIRVSRIDEPPNV